MELPGARTKAVSATLPGPRRGRVRVGELWATAEEIRGELDRVNARWLALKRAVAQNLPDGDATRAEFYNAWGSWRAFYSDARGAWMAWEGNREEAQRWDEEADAWRRRLNELGITVANPTASDTASRPGAWMSGTQAVIALLAIGGIVYLVTRPAGAPSSSGSAAP